MSPSHHAVDGCHVGRVRQHPVLNGEADAEEHDQGRGGQPWEPELQHIVLEDAPVVAFVAKVPHLQGGGSVSGKARWVGE